MLILARNGREKLHYFEALCRRMPRDVATEEQYRIAKAGYEGECRVDREWHDMLLQRPHYIFHDYELCNDAHNTHQIDTIFICPFFVLLLEVKNVRGRLDFEQHTHQFTRTNSDGTVDIFRNPIDQIERHRLLVEALLVEWGVQLPVIPAIIMSNSMAHIGLTPPNYHIFHVSGLRLKLQHFLQQYTEPISFTQLEYLKNQLLTHYKKKPFARPPIPSQAILGALCPKCPRTVRLSHVRGKTFYCPVCNERFEDAILDGLRDYRLLFGEVLTNESFRKFFSIDSVKVAGNLLSKLQLEKKGERKTRQYFIGKEVTWNKS